MILQLKIILETIENFAETNTQTDPVYWIYMVTVLDISALIQPTSLLDKQGIKIILKSICGNGCKKVYYTVYTKVGLQQIC